MNGRSFLHFGILTGLGLGTLVVQASAAPRRCESWQTGYTGADAAGPHVLGYWKFQPDAVTRDSSGKGNDLTLAGAQPAPQGKIDGALESFSNKPGVDQRHAAIAPNKPELSPKGAFTIELWVKPRPDIAEAQQPVLIDKKYVAQTDYQLRLSSADKTGNRRLILSLGFGDDSETMTSEAFQPGEEWQHLAFTYDGAGEVRFFRNGVPIGLVRKPGRGSVAAGKFPLSIGDRTGSTYAGFAGLIDEVRICDGVLEFRPAAVEFHSERKVWQRMESGQSVGVTVYNLGKTPMSHVTLRLSLGGRGEKMTEIATLAPGGAQKMSYPVDTTLRPDTYRLKAHLEATGTTTFVSDEETEITLVSRPLPQRMPVVMWGLSGGEGVRKEMARLKDIGFTLCIGPGADYAAIWDAGKPTRPEKEDQIAEEKKTLDFALANDFGIAFALSPGRWLKDRPELARLDRNGKPYARTDVNAAMPGLADFCFNVGASLAQTYDHFPAWQATLINSENRDDSQISFSPFDHEAYRKFAGTDFPAEVTQKGGVEWSKLKSFPADRVIADDDPIRKFYRWFWTTGDGWNGLHTAVHRGVKSTGRNDMWTWFDPAIRAPSIGGSGGGVDVLEQWTYTYPDPLRIGFFTDELRAMAANSPQHPRVMKMTQLIMYRSQTAPKQSGTNKIASPFDDHDPDAAYITTAPMHVREAFWTELARPVSGLMFHGWQSLVPTDSTGGYRYTNPDTQGVLRELLHGVVEPLGPTLLQVDDRPADVAYLDSFTSQMFARRGSYGYLGDEAYLTLLYAQLQPEVIYEGQPLDRYKVLVLADCDVLPGSEAKRIEQFQQRGGVVIGDENLAPAIKPDILIPKVKRTKKGDVDKVTLLANAAALRTALDARYVRHAESSNPEIVARCREAGASEYVFVVNDHREFGTYIGQHGLVMENGLPSQGQLTLRRPEGRVYDLTTSREIKTTSEAGRLQWPVDLGPCEGRIYLVTPKAIDRIEVKSPGAAKQGSRCHLSVRVCDPDGQPISAVVPVHLQISDPAGRTAEFSGYYGAKDGQIEVPIDIASNDASGVWEVRARELASGLEATAYLRVSAP
jgi:hypothetical protein